MSKPWTHNRFYFKPNNLLFVTSDIDFLNNPEHRLGDGTKAAIQHRDIITGENGRDSSERWRQLLGIAGVVRRSSAECSRAPAR